MKLKAIISTRRFLKTLRVAAIAGTFLLLVTAETVRAQYRPPGYRPPTVPGQPPRPGQPRPGQPPGYRPPTVPGQPRPPNQPPRPGQPQPGHPNPGAPQPAQPQMSNYERQQLQREQELRRRANELLAEGKYGDAYRAAKEAVHIKRLRTKRTTIEDDRWLNKIMNSQTGGERGARTTIRQMGPLAEELALREKAVRMIKEGRYDTAVEAAEQAIEAKRRRTNKPITYEDQQWLTNIRNEAVTGKSGFSVADLDKIAVVEFQDKWYEPGGELMRRDVFTEKEHGIKGRLVVWKLAGRGNSPESHEKRRELAQLEQQRQALLDQIANETRVRNRLVNDGEYLSAVRVGEELIAVLEKLYGANDVTVAVALGENARIYLASLDDLSLVPRAYAAYRQRMAAIFGPDHWRTKTAEVELAEADKIIDRDDAYRRECRLLRVNTFMAARLLDIGKYYQALQIARDNIEKLRFEREVPRSEYANALLILAAIHRAMGNPTQAAPLQLRAVETLRELYGEKHPDYIQAISTYGQVLLERGDFEQAHVYAARAVELGRDVWGPGHRRYGIVLAGLGEILLEQDRVDDAFGQFQAAWAIAFSNPKRNQDVVAAASAGLGTCYRISGRLDEARPMINVALNSRKKLYGDRHPLYLRAVEQLALLYRAEGNYEAAATEYGAIVEAYGNAYGARGVDRAQYQFRLAELLRILGHHETARQLMEASLRHMRYHLDTTFAVLSERQQLAMTQSLREMLSGYLSLAIQLELPAEQPYRHLLAWKGAVLRRQRKIRSATDDPEARELLDQLQDTSRQLATLALARPDVGQQQQLVESMVALSARKEQLESELTRLGAISQSTKQKADAEQKIFSRLQEALPDDGALVDFLEFVGPTPDFEKGEPALVEQLVAFVVRKDRPPAIVYLGHVEPIRDLGEQWRGLIVRHQGGVAEDERGLRLQRPEAAAKKPPQPELRRLLWEPLEERLDGVKTVLVSPDGAVARLPLAALPGREPGKYLIEERGIVTVPVPRLLPELLAVEQTARPAPSMFLLGGVDFAASPGFAQRVTGEGDVRASSSPDRSGMTRFVPLPGTEKEVDAIADFFQQKFDRAALKQIKGADATEQVMRAAATGHRYLHLATHGFFLPDTPGISGVAVTAGADDGAAVDSGKQSSPKEIPFGLRSGLALAGANNPPDPTLAADETKFPDDGILTALEVAALDLDDTELAVLSACETGLGKAASGEGLLGLQRAFQVAGADATLTSLWKVDDLATQTFMIEFYRHLWEDGLSKGEAMWQAQRTMLERYDPKSKQLRPRGLSLKLPEGTQEEKVAERLSPYYWAAFVLSGDWR